MGPLTTPGQREVIDTISKSCAYGDFEKLKQFVEADPSCVNQPDESGYYPLQWAALNNRVAETTYLLSQGASINTADHTGQTALHWASVRGSLPVVETLLRHGANHDVKDNRGYTVAHVASQYGQTAVLYHLALKWGMDIDQPDNDGRTALHWAAYKGYADTIRLLLVLDARYTLADKEGCTPLHWAAIKGNGEACTVLLQGGSVAVLSYKDMTGSTPAQLAVEKGHRYLGLHLAEYKQKQEGGGAWGKNGKMSWLTSTQLCPVIWLLILGLVTMFIHKVSAPQQHVNATMAFFSWSVVVVAGIGLLFLYKTTTADPGFIAAGWSSSNKREEVSNHAHSPHSGDNPRQHLLSQQYKSLDSPALWAGNWHQLCVSCRIVRPLRAKHCSLTDRCIEVFDHFCPWVGNAIGKGNRHLFVIFLWLELYALVTSAVVGIIQIQRHVQADEWGANDLVWMICFEVLDVFVGISVAALAVAQVSQVARNVTTNELANWHRYKYLQTSDGSFHNPFNKGVWGNCVDTCAGLKAPSAPVYLFREASPSSTGQPHL